MAKILQTTNKRLDGIRNSIENARSTSPLKPMRYDVDQDGEVEIGEDQNIRRKSFIEIVNKNDEDEPII